MKKLKMSFANVQGVLSRDELRQIMAGSGSGCGTCKGTYGTGTCVRNGTGGCNCPIDGTCK